jgi:hypothetical protein
MWEYGDNSGLQRREIVKNEVEEFLVNNKYKMTAKFSRSICKKHGFTFSALAGLVSEIKGNI